MARIVALALFFATLLAVAAARADDQERLGLQIKATVSGEELPGLVVTPREGVKSLTVKLTRGDGDKGTLHAGAVPAGQTKELHVKQPQGRFDYDATFSVAWASGAPSQFTLRFSLTRVDKLKLELNLAEVDLDARKMTFRMSNPAKRAELTLFGPEGKQIAQASADYGAAAAGSPLELAWSDPGGEVVYMDLKVFDIAGFWTGIRLTPFSIEIPHEDVEFDFGKHNIRKSEEPKLDDTLKRIKDALEKHGTLLQMHLFIAGYTDTVGSKASNQTLSNNRARSLAGWFRNKGLKIPISYQGFGEEVLATPTPDDTPEQKNRRAIYILSTQLPAKSSTFPRQSWQDI
jgi:outer membrane protein OmpA-like peptidoglycan-associated protein